MTECVAKTLGKLKIDINFGSASTCVQDEGIVLHTIFV